MPKVSTFQDHTASKMSSQYGAHNPQYPNIPTNPNMQNMKPQKPTKVEFLGAQFDIETFKFAATSFYYLMIFITVWYSFKFFFMIVQ